MNKAQMSLEYIVKIMILLVVIAVIIGLITKFSDDIRRTIKDLFPKKDGPEHDFPQLKEKTEFSAGEISAFIESCYSTMTSIPEDEQEDVVCYLLQAENGFTITPDNLRDKLSPELEDKVDITTNFEKDVIKIEYQDVGNSILVRD